MELSARSDGEKVRRWTTKWETLFGHPIVEASWEGFIIENILNSISTEIEAHYYRTSASAEIDLLLNPPGREPVAVEIKQSLSPAASKGFHIASGDVQAAQRYLLCPGTEGYPINAQTRTLSVPTLIHRILDGP